MAITDDIAEVRGKARFDRGFTVREPAWHGLATVLDEYPGREKAMELAGHNWEPIARPVFAYDPETATYSAVNGWKALTRSDNHAAIACQRDSYEIVKNATLWDICDNIVNLPNVRYETAGILNGGALLWVLAWLDEPTVIKGDDSATYPFVMVSTSHDGTGACKASAINIRTVCVNTFRAAERQSAASGLEYVFRHSKNVNARIEEAKAALKGARTVHSEFIALCNELADMSVSPEGRRHFLSRFIPEPEAAVCTARVRQNILEARQAIVRVLEGSRTIAEAHRGTALGLFNAGVEYLDHLRGYRNSESYFRRCMMSQDRLKASLIALAHESAAV